MSTHGVEPVRGLPARLPEGERMLWQGAPDWRSVLMRVLHARKVMIYFAVLMVWRFAAVTADTGSAAQGAEQALWLTPALVAALGILAIIAVAIARTTVYSITSRRVVLRFGVAIDKAFNIPFKAIAGVDLKAFKSGAGDIALKPAGDNRIAYLVLWPHARPWKFSPAQPALRALPDAHAAAQILVDAMNEYQIAASADAEAAPAQAEPERDDHGATAPAPAAA